MDSYGKYLQGSYQRWHLLNLRSLNLVMKSLSPVYGRLIKCYTNYKITFGATNWKNIPGTSSLILNPTFLQCHVCSRFEGCRQLLLLMDTLVGTLVGTTWTTSFLSPPRGWFNLQIWRGSLLLSDEAILWVFTYLHKLLLSFVYNFLDTVCSGLMDVVQGRI